MTTFRLPTGKFSKINGKCIALVFDDDRKVLNGRHPFDLEDNKGASILIVNSNFGCGSSREHAPQALMRWGIKAIIGESFAEIFYSNCVAIGIPCFTLSKTSIKDMQEYIKNNLLFLEIDLRNSYASSKNFNFDLVMKDSSKKMFLSGEWDATSTLLKNTDLIEKKFIKLPYIEFNQDKQL